MAKNGNISKTSFSAINTGTVITKQQTYEIREAINRLISYGASVDNCGNCSTYCQTCQSCQSQCSKPNCNCHNCGDDTTY